MVAGTASDVGKSVIATALCRVLADEGFAVAPFKAQNMSLNAAVAQDGEIGRAQAAQAEAARVAPRVDMNPVLLKPEGARRSQVVVLGRSSGSKDARDYWRTRGALWPVVGGALRRLREEFAVVVIEGAGSFAELNLARTDLANQRLARAADARVLLVGDIERGGVFAQLLGTLDLLAERDRARVRGLLVNKFRGDPALFADGARILARRGRVPVLGVLPHEDGLGVPAEDSLGVRSVARQGATDVCVIRLPHISNFDEFAPLVEAGASVRYAATAAEIGSPDLLVVPGSKTTIADLEWLRRGGIGARLRALADAGVPVLGICGGFQMLGESLTDPDGVEGPAATVRGLALLPARTSFTRVKRTVRVTGEVAAGWLDIPAVPVEGYEIHLGTTAVSGVAFGSIAADGEARHADGAVDAQRLVAGTYVHGLFEHAPFRDAVLGALARRRGAAFAPSDGAADRYAALAAWLRASVDVPRMLRLLEIA
ncbi:MAG: cobyric acid synthase [Chloroflexi bacterium]|nr:cobyric acid synthase [Chloroflexota bacterium]